MQFLVLVFFCIYSVALAVTAKPDRFYWLLASAGLAMLFSAALYNSGISLALLPLAVSLVFLFLVIVRRVLGSTGQKRPIWGAISLFVGVVAAFPLLLINSSIAFPELEGAYAVGVRAAEIIDSDRGHAWNAKDNNPRRIVLRLWYPARSDQAELPTNLKTVEERSVDRAIGSGGVNPFRLFGEPLDNVDTHAQWNAPAFDGSFPLLLFSHGYMGQVNSNAVLMEQLASQGFVVVSMTHPGESTALFYLDGSFEPRAPQTVDMMAEHAESGLWEAFQLDTAERMDWVRNVFAHIQLVVQRLPVWADDYRSVLDALEQGNYTGDIGEILTKVDFGAVGYMGMSAGAGAGPGACHVDSRCDAAVALDGAPLEYLYDTHSRIPVLLMDGGYPNRLGGQDLYYEPHGQHGLSPDIFRVVFPYNGHTDFTDIALVLSPLGKKVVPAILPVLGPVDGVESLLTQSRLATRFFDIYLRNGNVGNFPDSILESSDTAQLVNPEAFKQWYHSQSTTE